MLHIAGKEDTLQALILYILNTLYFQIFSDIPLTATRLTF